MSDGLKQEAARTAAGNELAGYHGNGSSCIDDLKSLQINIAALRQRIVDNVDGYFILPDDRDEIDVVIADLIQQVKDFSDTL